MYKALIGLACAAVIVVGWIAYISEERAKREAVDASVRSLIVTLEEPANQSKRNAAEVAFSNNLRDAW